MKIEAKTETRLKELTVQTGLTDRELEDAALELPRHGETGIAALNTIRSLANAVNILDGSVLTLKLSLDAIYDPDARIRAEIQLDLVPSQQRDLDNLLSTPISELREELGVRAWKGLVRLGIKNIGQLINTSGEELLAVHHFGVTSLSTVREVLSRRGLQLKGD